MLNKISRVSLPKTSGILKFMDGLYVGNTYFDLSGASENLYSAVFLSDNHLSENAHVFEQCNFATHLSMKVDFSMIYFSQLEIVLKLFEMTGSLMIVSEKHSYACLFASAIAGYHGNEISLEMLKEMTKITDNEERIFGLINNWKKENVNV